MVGCDSVGRGLQFVEARFLNFSQSWWSRDFEVHEMLTSPEFTAFYLRAGRGQNLVIVIVGSPHQAVHAGGDDCQHPCAASLFIFMSDIYTIHQSAHASIDEM